MFPGRELPAVVDDRFEFAVAQTVGVSLSHPVCQSILLQIVAGFAMVPGLGRLAVVAFAGPSLWQIPTAFGAVRGNVGQDSNFLSYLVSPPFKFSEDRDLASLAASRFFLAFSRI